MYGQLIIFEYHLLYLRFCWKASFVTATRLCIQVQTFLKFTLTCSYTICLHLGNACWFSIYCFMLSGFFLVFFTNELAVGTLHRDVWFCCSSSRLHTVQGLTPPSACFYCIYRICLLMLQQCGWGLRCWRPDFVYVGTSVDVCVCASLCLDTWECLFGPICGAAWAVSLQNRV